MDDIDFDFTDEPTGSPACRATIRDGALTLHPWQPWLIRGGPARVHTDALAERGITLADLSPIDGEAGKELVVQWVPQEAGCAAAEAVIEEWAAIVGYQRVWLPGRVAEIEPDDTLEMATATCPVCTCTWNDSGPDFWGVVRGQGWFPTSCYACGAWIPEWTLSKTGGGADREEAQATAGDGQPATRSPARSRSL